MHDIIIIGGGPAGLTAGIYAARQKLNALLITKEFGGQMAKKEVEIENYPGLPHISAQDLISKFREHIEKLEIETQVGQVQKIEKNDGGFSVFVGAKNFLTRAVLVATGSDPRFLGVPGEKEFIGRGVGYCVTCDGPLFANREVAVAGGGNSALEAAIFLARFARKVYILESGDKIGADLENQSLAQKTGKISLITSAKVLRIIGEKFVNSVVYQNIIDGKEIILPVEGIFVKIGYRPASLLAEGLADLNDRGEIVFDHETFQTKTPGFFSAGDVSDAKYKQIIIACAEGAKAALSIREYLKNK